MNTDKLTATIGDIVSGGKHGAYAVAYAIDQTLNQELGAITISMCLWDEPFELESGMEVVLSSFSKKPAGWRANAIHPITPEEVLANKEN